MLTARELWVGPPGAPAEPVVRGVSLEVRGGEWVAITGPNGCGKTTLLLALAGLIPVARGKVELDGHSFGPGATGSRRDVAVVLQDLSSQMLQRSVVEEIGFGPRNLGWVETDVRRATEHWCARLGLQGMLARDPRTLSAGFQQLTLIAAALAARPRVLLVDEGGAHLDPASRAVLLTVLRQEVSGGLALVWVTQEPDEMAAADRTLVLGAMDSGNGPGPMDRPESAPRVAETPLPAVARVAIEPATGIESPGPRVILDSRKVWEIPGRGVVGIEGPNGSGKSTLLGALAAILKTPQVAVEWLGPVDPGPILSAQHPEEQVFAETVEEEVFFAATQRRMSSSIANQLVSSHFEALGLGRGFLSRRTWSLSLGEKRLLQVVAAIVAPASVVLLDEPTSGLDTARRAAIGRLVSGRARAGPVIVAGHDHTWLEPLTSSRIKLGVELASYSKKTD